MLGRRRRRGSEGRVAGSRGAAASRPRGRAAWVQILFFRAEATRGRRRLRGLAVMEKRERSRPSVTAATVTNHHHHHHHHWSSPIPLPRLIPHLISPRTLATLSDHFLCIG